MVTVLHDALVAEDFLRRRGVQLIVHSPLLRAQRTCSGIFDIGVTAPLSEQESIPILPHALLYEQDVLETLGLGNLVSAASAFPEPAG